MERRIISTTPPILPPIITSPSIQQDGSGREESDERTAALC
jgi:hypothetical protein